MTVKNTKKDHPDSSTQRYLPFSQIRENIIIMKDNSARLVMRCSTVNFLLKNSDEKDSIIISFQKFLNTLDFPIQILVRSKKLDIDGYLNNLNDKALKQKNPLLQNQTYEYIEYLRKLIEVAQIMKKEFYIIIPFDENENKSVKDDSLMWVFNNFWQSINWWADLLKIKTQIKNFSKMKKWLLSRSNSIKTWLDNILLRAEMLDKQELVTFLTEYYNPSLDSLVQMNSSINDYNLINN